MQSRIAIAGYGLNSCGKIFTNIGQSVFDLLTGISSVHRRMLALYRHITISICCNKVSDNRTF